MAVVNQLNLNVGTEQNPNFVLHDINDKRISTTAVTTATHLLTCNSSVTSIAPITAANLASVLGAYICGVGGTLIPENEDLDNYTTAGVYKTTSASITASLSHAPGVGAFTLFYISPFSTAALRADSGVQIAIGFKFGVKIRKRNGGAFDSAWTTL